MINKYFIGLRNKWRDYLNRNNLSFSSLSDEEAFFQIYVGETTTSTQIFMAIGGITFLSYMAVDILIDPLNYFTAHTIRIYYSTPLIFACVFLIFFPYFRKRVEYVVVFSGFVIISAQSLVFSTLNFGYNYAVPGFAIIFLIRSIVYIIRITYLLFIALFALVGTIGGHIIANNSGDGWIIVNTLGILTAVALGLVAALARERRARAQFMANRALERSRARAEALVGSLLPSTMIERLRAGEKDIADMIGEVSVVFADIADFTALSRRLSPKDLIRLLDDVFSRFDRAAELWGMEKITTIGDAYMAIGGMYYTEKRRDIAIAAAQFALEIKKQIGEVIAETGYPINLRIGIHIGPIVAGVVGERRPTFDCWGDTVRIAAGLEGHATSGSILISDIVVEALGDCGQTGTSQSFQIKDMPKPIRAHKLLNLRKL